MMKIQAPAKLNLNLEVTGKRADGYHLLESDVVFLNLCDELEFEKSDKLSINSDISDNIILKAARALDVSRGVNIKLTKKIPMGGGLGGGSANAAATLVALNKLWGLNLPEAKLYEIGLKLGADVPVCLFSHLEKTATAHFSGVGELLRRNDEMPSKYFLLVNPNKNLPTIDVFRKFKLTDQQVTGNKNDLEPSAIELVPEIKQIIELLANTKGNLFARMTGTGSTCFAVYNNLEDANLAAAQVPDIYWKIVAEPYSY